MRQVFIAVVACGFIGAVWTLLRQPAGRVSWLVIAYFVSHAIFVLGIYWAAGRAAGNSREYFETYQILSFFPLVIACGLSFRFALEHDRVEILLISLICTLFVASGLSRDVKAALHVESVPPAINWNFVLGVGFTAFAVSTFVSLAHTDGDIESHLRLALAGFWFVFGVWHFAFAIGKLNRHLGWIARQDWIPTFAAFVCCLWIGYKLNTSQRELSTQALPDLQQMEQMVAEPIYERGGLPSPIRAKTAPQEV